MKKTNRNGITLVSLVVTIIILLILAGISIAAIRGDNGLFAGAKKAKIQSELSAVKEEVIMAINTLMTDYYGDTTKITPKMVADQVNKDNNRDTYAEDENAFPTNIIYPANTNSLKENIIIGINSNLQITTVKTESGDIIDRPPSGDGSTDVVGDINANVTITNVTGKSFIINVDIGENVDKILLYQYFVNGNMVYEGTETQYKVRGLDLSTNYKVSVNVVPKTSVNVATLEQRTNDTIVIEMANNFDKYIYIDSNNGNDATGNGNINNPYATLDKIADSGIIENGHDYAIILRDGTYTLTNKIVTLLTNSNINIIGNRGNTKLYSNLECGTGAGIGYPNYKINFYRLVLEDNTNMAYEFYIYSPLSFYNVVFNYINTPTFGYILPKSGDNVISNCTIIKGENLISKQQEGNMRLINCYGKVTSGYSTNDSMWNYQTNYITSTPQIDSTTYRITDNESVWKGVGTGMNPDETQANLGVYGGEYSWDYDTDLD